MDGALYKAMEFAGSAIRGLSMDSRFTICNMAIEAGGKSGIIAPDDVTKAYVEGRYRRTPRYYTSDPDCWYEKVYRWKAEEIPLMVAKPHLPSNTQPAAELSDIKIDQVVIGSCTNGRIEDLRQAAEILRGRKVHKDVRLIVIPATPAIWKQANDEGLFDVFVEAEGGRIGAHLRTLPGRPHGRAGRGRASRRDHQPQLRGPHGPPGLGGLPGRPVRGRGQRGRGVYRHARPARRRGPGGGAGAPAAEGRRQP